MIATEIYGLRRVDDGRIIQPMDLTGLSIFILEDEPLLRKQLAARLEKLGADVTVADTMAAARNLVADLSFDFALLDVNLPDGVGIDLLRQKTLPQHTAVVVMTAQAKVSDAVEAIRAGAADYLVKPFEPAQLLLVIDRARRARQSNRAQEKRREETLETEDSFYFGSALQSVQTQIRKILEADGRLAAPLPPVLIQGETGTGKTSIARRIHLEGPRAAEPLAFRPQPPALENAFYSVPSARLLLSDFPKLGAS